MSESEKFWDGLSQNYDNGSKEGKIFKKTLEITRKHFKPSDRVLDYGCTTGLYSIELTGTVKEIYGIDIQPEMIESDPVKFEHLFRFIIDISRSNTYIITRST